jgi:CHAT domain-containing protein/tetratricopeptide (TPR) repeat protein
MRAGGLRLFAARVLAVAVCTIGVAASTPLPVPQSTAIQPLEWPPPSDPQLSQAYSASKQARDRRDYAEGTAAYTALVDRARQLHDDLWEARGLYGLGAMQSTQLKLDEANPKLEQAIAIFERLGDLHDLGAACVRRGANADTARKADEARRWFGRAVAAFDAAHDIAGKALAEFDDLRSRSAGPDDPRFPIVLEDARASGDHSIEGALLHAWGDEYFNAGDFEKAAERLAEAAALLERDNVDPNQLGTTYNSLGRLYRAHGQLTIALQYQMKALAIHEKLGFPYSYIQSLNAVAVTYQFLGDLAHATTYFKRALTVAEHGSTPQIVSFLRASYGDALVQMGQYSAGRALLIGALPETDPFYYTLRMGQIARADVGLRRFALARDEASDALAHCDDGARDQCLFVRLTRAYAETQLGDLDTALADHTAAVQQLEAQHASLAASDFMKQGFQEAWEPAYSLQIDLELRRGRTSEALEAAELGRSRALLDLLASREQTAAAASPMPSAIAHPTTSDSLRSGSVASPATVPQLVQIAARLQSTLVLYWVGDDHISIWTVAGDGTIHSAVTAMTARHLASLVKAVTAFASADDATAHAAIATRGAQSVPIVIAEQPGWHELYDALIQPIAAYLPARNGARVTIIPHGSLMAVPFAALKDRQGRYLVERYTIHEAPAGGLFAFTAQARKPDARSGSALLIADPTPTPRSAGEPPLPRLPGADIEVDAIAKLLPAGHATVLANAAATEPRVVEAIAHQALLHFATHAVVRDSNPSASFLALGRPADRSTSGELTPDKIYALKITADLVVLSACRSGGGPPNGDGVAALARAFFYAGAPSVMVSVWDVADSPTNRLLPAFYRAWLAGADKASALRTAQLKLIADLRAGRVTVHTKLGDFVLPENPAFWAGFVLLGEAD